MATLTQLFSSDQVYQKLVPLVFTKLHGAVRICGYLFLPVLCMGGQFLLWSFLGVISPIFLACGICFESKPRCNRELWRVSYLAFVDWVWISFNEFLCKTKSYHLWKPVSCRYGSSNLLSYSVLNLCPRSRSDTENCNNSLSGRVSGYKFLFYVIKKMITQ